MELREKAADAIGDYVNNVDYDLHSAADAVIRIVMEEAASVADAEAVDLMARGMVAASAGAIHVASRLRGRSVPPKPASK